MHLSHLMFDLYVLTVRTGIDAPFAFALM